MKSAYLPHDLSAEMGVLGSMLISPVIVIPMMIDGFDADRFHHKPNGTIYSEIVRMWRDNMPVDVITLTHALREAKQLDNVGGPSYVTQLFTFTPTDANASYYKEIVLDKADLRRIHLTADAVAKEAISPGGQKDELSERLQQLLTELTQKASTGSNVATMDELIPSFIERLEARCEGKGTLRGIPSGLAMLDRLTGGWQAGQMIVIAAPEKQGKSSLARQFAMHAAMVKQVPTAIFSHEMGREEIIDAMVPTVARVDAKRIEDGMLSEAEFIKISNAAQRLGKSPIFVYDEADCSVLQFRANARRAAQEHGCKLIVVDYLQLIAGGENESREQSVSEVGRNIKLAAKELSIPIIVLSQLNKEGVTQYARAIQQHLDKLIVIEHEDPEAEGEGKAWIRVKLQRGGAKGKVPVMWRPSFTSFDALADEKPRRIISATRPVTDADFQ